MVRDDGTPVKGLEIWVRNLMRIADFVPAFYGVGVLSILLSRRHKRLGDYAAGTLVVKIRATPPVRARFDPAPPARKMEAVRLTEEEYNLIRNFLLRRGELTQEQRQRLARRISAPLRERMPQAGEPPDGDEDFLWALAQTYTEQHRYL